MTVSELAERLSLSPVSGTEGLDNEITGCYIGDLLSLAMARVEEGTVWLTIQSNINVMAVASLQDAACVVIVDGFPPDENTIAKSDEVGIPILLTDKTAYEIAKGLAELGI